MFATRFDAQSGTTYQVALGEGNILTRYGHARSWADGFKRSYFENSPEDDVPTEGDDLA